MRFGTILGIWLDFLGISQHRFSDFAEIHEAHVGAIIRGRKKESGTEKPNRNTQIKIFAGLEKAIAEETKQPAEMTREIFWKGPHSDVHQRMMKSAHLKNDDDKSEPQPAPQQIYDLAAVLAGEVVWRGRRLSPNERERLLKLISAQLD